LHLIGWVISGLATGLLGLLAIAERVFRFFGFNLENSTRGLTKWKVAGMIAGAVITAWLLRMGYAFIFVGEKSLWAAAMSMASWVRTFAVMLWGLAKVGWQFLLYIGRLLMGTEVTAVFAGATATAAGTMEAMTLSIMGAVSALATLLGWLFLVIAAWKIADKLIDKRLLGSPEHMSNYAPPSVQQQIPGMESSAAYQRKEEGSIYKRYKSGEDMNNIQGGKAYEHWFKKYDAEDSVKSEMYKPLLQNPIIAPWGQGNKEGDTKQPTKEVTKLIAPIVLEGRVIAEAVIDILRLEQSLDYDA
jgi:hypothetical protein